MSCTRGAFDNVDMTRPSPAPLSRPPASHDAALADASSSNGWIGQFAAHLLRLDPALPPTYAVQCAVANIHCAGHLPPEQAARIVSAERARPEEQAAHLSQSARYREQFGPA